MDFNCLIYMVARLYEKENPYPGPGEHGSEWELRLCDEICKTTRDIYVLAGRPEWFLICLDGVVPMAKIRQQRMRRFKSAWLKELDGKSSTAWDTNCITPGTQFMKRLAKKLEELRATCGGRGFVLSDTDKPGEGEHKIMEWLRSKGAKDELKGNILIYGLDADLILLTMLASKACKNTQMYLLREHTEFNGANASNRDKKSEDIVIEYVTLNVNELQRCVGIDGSEEKMLQYICLMTLMGNDFIPHSLTHRLTEDGHDLVLKEVQRLKEGRGLVIKEGERWILSIPVLQDIVQRWSVDEGRRLCKMIERKRACARLPPRMNPDGSQPPEYESWPLKWDVEKVFLDGDGGLTANWREIYWTFLHKHADIEFKGVVIREYLCGLQWVLDYYTGQRAITTEWMFTCWLPPLWSDLATALEKGDVGHVEPPAATEGGEPIQPEEQLAMVLPRQSYWLVRNEKLRRLPVYAPHWFPTGFEVHSIGKRWMWECEVMVPVISRGALRAVVAEHNLQNA